MGAAKRIRAVITDMDGSFLRQNGQVSPANAHAVKKLRDNGILFLVCTGRTREEAIRPLREAGITCDMICMNGAAAYRPDGTQIRERILEKKQTAQVLAAADREEILRHLITDKGEFIIGDEKRFRDFFCTCLFPYMGIREAEQDEALGGYHRTTAAEFLEMDLKCYKIVTLCSEPQPLLEIEPALKSIESISAASSYATNWEITHEQATKGQALLAYAAQTGLELHQIMALGDGDNDLSMLELPLGLSVAMGNGVDAVKAAADQITGTNEEDGFAGIISRLWEA